MFLIRKFSLNIINPPELIDGNATVLSLFVMANVNILLTTLVNSFIRCA